MGERKREPVWRREHKFSSHLIGSDGFQRVITANHLVWGGLYSRRIELGKNTPGDSRITRKIRWYIEILPSPRVQDAVMRGQTWGRKKVKERERKGKHYKKPVFLRLLKIPFLLIDDGAIAMKALGLEELPQLPGEAQWQKSRKGIKTLTGNPGRSAFN